jgi:hypothetical protein
MKKVLRIANHTGLKVKTVLVALALFVAVFSGAATAQQGDVRGRIAQIDSTIEQWNNHLNSLYWYLNDPTLGWYYTNDPSYKASYDAWVANWWQLGQQDIQRLQAERAALVSSIQAPSVPPSGTVQQCRGGVGLLGECSDSTRQPRR